MSAQAERVASAPTTRVAGLGAPETPVLLPDGGWLLVEMAGDRSCVSRVAPGGDDALVVVRTGRPNGVAVHRDGTLWIADTDPPALRRGTLEEGHAEVALREAAGEPLLFPNDLCFGPDGALYLTDSGILLEDWAPGGELRPDWPAARASGRVLRLDVATLEARCLDRALRFANGIAFAPNGDLYANEMLTGAVLRYRALGEGRFGPREVAGNVTIPTPDGSFRGPDGMAFSADGRLWVTVFGQGDVTVLDRGGEVLERRPTLGRFPTNCAFGPPGERRLYVTEAEHGRLEVHDAAVDGAPVHSGGAA